MQTAILDYFQNTVYRENVAPVLFSPSDLRANLTRLIELFVKDYVRKF